VYNARLYNWNYFDEQVTNIVVSIDYQQWTRSIQGAMPSSSRRCGMITRREAERLVNSFLETTKPLNLPENFVFEVYHHCAWGCRGLFIPIRYNSSRAKCIRFDR
jgi:hypothetical protein